MGIVNYLLLYIFNYLYKFHIMWANVFVVVVWFGNPFDPNTISLIDEYANFDLTNPYVQTWHVLEISSTLVVTYIGPRWLNSNLYRTRETNSSQKFNYANLIPWLLKIYLRDTGSISVQQNMPCNIVIWGEPEQ